MANLLQIKRSTSTGTATGLANGELAYSSATDALFIGSPNGSVVAIGGVRIPGTLTANQALVANSTSGINNIISANLTLSGSLTANGSLGTAGQSIFANATGGVYWATPAASFSNGTAYTWSAIQTHTANINIGNTTVNTQISNSIFIAMDGNTATHNTSSISVGNATINATMGPATLVINGAGIANSTGANNAFSLGGALAATYVNTSAAFTIAGILTHSANLHTGNTTVNSQFSNSTILISNATSTTTIGLTDIRVGNTTTNVVISNTVSSFSGNVSITGVANVTGNVTLGSASFFVGNGNFLSTVNATNITTGTLPYAQLGVNVVNTSAAFTIAGILTHSANLHTGNTTVNSQFSNAQLTINAGNTGTVNASSVSVGNATINATFGPATILINGAGIANSTGANNAFSLGGALAAAYVNTSAAFTIAGILTHSANLHTGNTTVNSMFSNAAILLANATTTTSFGLTDIRLGSTASNVVISNTTSTFAGNLVITNTANVAGNVVFSGANTNIAGQLVAGNAAFGGSITVAGNLTVSGTTTTIDTTTLAVKDNFALFAAGVANTGVFLDNVDMGIYIATGNTSANYYSGFTRIATSSTNTNPYFKLFSTQTSPNNTTVDTGATTGTLQAYLAPYGAGGGFIANATVVNITANATVSSALVANSLTLTTALVGTSGGTGKLTMTNQALLVGNATNGYTELALGTNTYFLQSNGTALVYSANLDGGSF